jgi:transcriptional regulator NrdR family protein
MARSNESGVNWRGNGKSLACPVCEMTSLRVLESRAHKGTIRRYRWCARCEFKFFTKEVICTSELGRV